MKKTLKNRAISAVVNTEQLYRFDEIKIFDYAHEEPLLGEIAGHVFNRYLRFRKEKTINGERYVFRFGGGNPNKAVLQLHVFVDSTEEKQSNGRIREEIYENACEEFLFKAFEAIDKVHKLDNNFFEKIKYFFKK